MFQLQFQFNNRIRFRILFMVCVVHHWRHPVEFIIVMVTSDTDFVENAYAATVHDEYDEMDD